MKSLTIHISMVSALLCAYSHAMQEKPQKDRQLTAFESSFIGALAGICEVTINQPAITLKNKLQTQIKATNSESGSMYKKISSLYKEICNQLQTMTMHERITLIKDLYKGYGVNVGSMAPITALQVGVNNMLSAYLPHSPSDSQKIGAAFLAGGTSALVSSPADMLVIQQGQIVKDTFAHTLKALFGTPKIGMHMFMRNNLKKLYRGILPTATRDGGFTVGYLALGDVLKKQLNINTGNTFIDTILAGIPAGLIAGVATHPFDTVSTTLKRDLTKSSYTNTFQAFAKILKDEGIRGLFKGLTPRTSRIAIAIPLLSYVNHYLGEKIK